MSVLDKLKRGASDLPPRIVLAGPEGVGKTTWAAGAPDPLFIATENGLKGIAHIPHLEPANFGETLTLIDELIGASKIEFKTIIIDTVDWLERSIHQFICRRDSTGSRQLEGIEDYGYGKGYKVAEVELVKLLSKLDALQQKHKVGVIILSHVQIKPFNSPEGKVWDRYQMKGHKEFTGILREWPDACLFATYEVHQGRERGTGREKVIGSERIIRTTWSHGWDAKNRLNLPETLPMPEDGGYALFEAQVVANSPVTLRTAFNSLLATAKFKDEATKLVWTKVNLENLMPARIRDGIAKLEAMQ